MTFFSFNRWLRGQRTQTRTPIRNQYSRNGKQTRLGIESLEDRTVPSNTGTIHLTNGVNGDPDPVPPDAATVVEQTHYLAKPDVYVYGNQFLAAGYYDVEVVSPGGKSGNTDDVLGISDPNSPVQYSGGQFVSGSGAAGVDWVTGPRGTAFNVWDEVISTGNTNGNPPAGSTGYDDTDNPGGEYQVVLAVHQDGETSDQEFAQFAGNNGLTKSKNFKVEEQAPLATSIVTNFTLTQPDGSYVYGPNAGGTTAVIGSTAQDSATVTVTSGGVPVTEGTVDFQFYGPNGLIDDTSVPVDSNGMATDPFVSGPLGAGDYYFVAGYSDGDTYGSSQSDSEPFTIPKASPSINTTASGAITLDASGAPTISDSAVVSGAYNATGSIHFALSLNGTTVYSTDDPLTGDGNGTYSASYTLPTTGTVAGTYTWSVTYTGDGNNNPAVDQGGAAEQTVVSKANPSIVTQASGAITLGPSGAPTISDSAVVSGAYNATGSIHFALSLGGTTVYSTDDPLTGDGNGTYSASYTLPTSGTVAGTYTWSVTYVGDGNNNSAVDEGGTAEQTVVSKATPSIVTSQQPPSALVGTPIGDHATVSGGYYPTGTVTFKLYNNPNGTGTPLFTDTEPLVNGVSTSALYTPMAIGIDYWVATYNGDGNNISVTSGTSLEPVNVYGGGLTPGFWRANADNYGGSAWKFTAFSPTTKLSSIFNLGAFSGLDTTLQGALDNYSSAGTTVQAAAQKLLWDATAALLNATYNYTGTTVGYPLTVSQIVSQVNSALASGDRATIIQEAMVLDIWNNLGFQNGIAQKTGKPA
jgi:hypothetical protein